MNHLRLKCPSDPKFILILIPRLFLFFLIMLPVTVLFVLVPIGVIAIAMLIGIFIPIALCQPISHIPSKGCRMFASLMFLIFYPLLAGLTMFTLLLMVLLYPFLRNKNHHGAYDPFDNGLAMLAIGYLRFSVWLLYCCASE